MVSLLRATDAFHAKVVAARLGADGIVTQFRGGIDTPYPGGAIEVLVREDDLEAARELLLADEIEAAFLEDGSLEEPSPHVRRPWMVALVVVALVAFAWIDLLAARG